MIRKTLKATQSATFSIQLPSEAHKGMPVPAGTGFFVSADGWFLTAAHVVFDRSTQAVCTDIGDAWLMKEGRPPLLPGEMCQFPELVEFLPDVDVALLKVDWDKNKNKDWLKDRSGFPFITASLRQLDEGESVYAFGYPLSEATLEQDNDQMSVGSLALCPRVTSAIVSSTLERTAIFTTDADPRVYVLDKALNYGNSGGPIVAEETGYAHALCSRFQPVFIPQVHLANAGAGVPYVAVPSLYGIVTRFDNGTVHQMFDKHGIAYKA